MPWEITIRRPDDVPLGEMDAVRKQMTNSLAGLQFCTELSGAEKLAASDAKGIPMPDSIRKFLEGQPAVEQAEYEGDGFSIQLYGFENKPLMRVHAEVRGNGNPLPAIAALCVPNGWVAKDDASGQLIDLAGESAASWEAFTAYRDRAIKKLHAQDS